MFLIFLQFTLVYCQEVLNKDNIVVGNIRKRAQIPLYQMNRRSSNDLSYRRTKDIRDVGTDQGRTDNIQDRQVKEVAVMYDKTGVNEIFNQNKDEKYHGNRNIIYDWNRSLNKDEVDSQREEIIERKVDGSLFNRPRQELQETQRNDVWSKKYDNINLDKNKNEIIERREYATDRRKNDVLDRRFEQLEREAIRLEDTQEKLEDLHQGLRWLTINTDQGLGIGI